MKKILLLLLSLLTVLLGACGQKDAPKYTFIADPSHGNQWMVEKDGVSIGILTGLTYPEELPYPGDREVHSRYVDQILQELGLYDFLHPETCFGDFYEIGNGNYGADTILCYGTDEETFRNFYFLREEFLYELRLNPAENSKEWEWSEELAEAVIAFIGSP